MSPYSKISFTSLLRQVKFHNTPPLNDFLGEFNGPKKTQKPRYLVVTT